MSTAIVWFRRDLRLADQPALAAACAGHDRVIPLYVHAPEEDGDWPPGGAQRWWLHRSLHALAADLARAGAPLVVRRGPSRAAIGDLVDATAAAAVYWNRCHEPQPRARDAALESWLQGELGVRVETFNSALLFEPGDVRTGQGTPYRVFTPFWRRVTANGLPDAVAPAPDRVPGPAHDLASVPVAALDLLPRTPWYEGLAANWTPGEAGAQARLADFRSSILDGYDGSRDHPAVDGTSALSPHLHFGEIGPRQVVRAVHTARHGQGAAAKAYLAELGWREFAAHLLHHFPDTPDAPLDPRFERFPWRDPGADAAAELAAWQRGITGIPLVDAGMRQLWHTGWMHNRVRMVVASFLTKNLRLDWRLGATWFWDTLVDADLASNTLGWQWAAGCGADAAPYFRIFNPVRQGERFDPDGAYVRRWVPELTGLTARHIHAPWQAPATALAAAGVEPGRTYPRPIVDLQDSRRRALAAFENMTGIA